MEILSWIGVALGLFTGVLMVTKKDNSLSDRLLSGWLFLLGIEFLSAGIDYDQFGYPLMSNAFLLMNPAFFLYVRSQVDPGFRLKWLQLLHLLPYLAFEIAAYILKEPLEFQNFLKPTGYFFFRLPFGAISLLSWALYNGSGILIVLRHRKAIGNEFSNPVKGRSAAWILFILLLYMFICFVASIMGLVTIMGNAPEQLPHFFTQISLLVLIFLLAFYGLRQERIRDVFYPEVSGYPEKENLSGGYKKTHLSQERKEEIQQQLIHYFEREKPYLDPNLNMDLLSSALQIPKHHLTEVLNTRIGRNFFQFVNRYRVEAVRELLQDPDNQWSIEAIGYECGFSSKSSFFSTFKKLTGITPSQFRAR